jgi:hypothetical protein
MLRLSFARAPLSLSLALFALVPTWARTLLQVNPKLMQHQRAVRRGGRRGMVSSLTSSLPSPGPHTPEMSSYMGSSVGSDSPWANMNSAEEGESDGDEDEEVESAEELRCA